MKRFAIPIAVAAAVLLSPAVTAAEAQTAPIPRGAAHLVLGYDGLLLIKVLDLRIEQSVEPGAFSADAQLRTSGVLALFKKVDVHAVSQGAIHDDTLTPASFHHENRDGQDNRKVLVHWDSTGVTTDAAPLWPNMGDPAATPAQKATAADPLTQLMRVSLNASPDGPCHGAMRMFDGRQLYDVTLSTPRPRPRTAAETRFNLDNPLSCNLDLREVAGFDAKPNGNKSQGLKMPVILRLAQTTAGGPWIITGLTGQTPLGDARIELRSVKAEG